MASSSDISSAWATGIYDAHCHPTDIMSAIDRIPKMKAKVLTIMATRAQDQDLVAETARRFPVGDLSSLPDNASGRVIPSFGWHPWFTYQLFDDRDGQSIPMASEHYKSVLTPCPEDSKFLESLPPPKSLSEYLSQTETRLNEFPYALVGEVGLDRAFRVPKGPYLGPPGNTTVKTGGAEEGEFTPGSREGRALTSSRVKMDHQKIILKAQLELAAKFCRPISIHSVQAHGVVFELLQELWKGHENPSKRSQRKRKDVPHAVVDQGDDAKNQSSRKPYPQRICMHSYSGPVDALKQYLSPTVPVEVFFSFSELINFGSPASSKASDVIRALPDDRILVESDLHCAGDRMDELLETIFERVCDIKGWDFGKGAIQLKRNWERFVFGS